MLTPTEFERYVKSQALKSGLDECLVDVCILETINVEDYERAIIFYHGAWSGPSVAMFQLLCSSIAKSELSSFRLVVVNADELCDAQPALHELAQRLFGRVIGAWGETCWVRDGRVISQDVLWWKNSIDAERFTITGEYNRRIKASVTEVQEQIEKRISELF